MLGRSAQLEDDDEDEYEVDFEVPRRFRCRRTAFWRAGELGREEVMKKVA